MRKSIPLGLTQLESWKPKLLPASPYFEDRVEAVLSKDGVVTNIVTRVECEHPCKGVDANHFRLDLLLTVAPEQLQQVNFVVNNNFNLMDSIYNLKNAIHEKLSK